VHRSLADAERFSGACGGADVNKMLSSILKTMARGEQAEMRCLPAFCGGEEPLTITATVSDWVVVEPLPRTKEKVIKKILLAAPSEVWERPSEDASCTANLTVRNAASGEVVDEMAGKTFIQGNGDVLRCIDVAAREMKRGERALISAPAEWAYGDEDFKALSAAAGMEEAAVEVEMELVDFEQGKSIYKMDLFERAAFQVRKKEQGNSLFRKGKYEEAIRKYEAGNSAVPNAEDLKESTLPEAEKEGAKAEARKTQVACLVNVAACKLKLDDFKGAIQASDTALEVDKDNFKAFFRRAQARLKLGDIDEAKADLVAAGKIDPKSREVRVELDKIKKKMAENKSRDKNLYGGMFR